MLFRSLAALPGKAEAFNASLFAAPTSGDVGAHWSDKALLALSPGTLVLSSLTVSHDGKRLVVRFYNPLRESLQAKLSLGMVAQEVHRADAAENLQQQLAPVGDEHDYELQVGPAEIVTLMVRP